MSKHELLSEFIFLKKTKEKIAVVAGQLNLTYVK